MDFIECRKCKVIFKQTTFQYSLSVIGHNNGQVLFKKNVVLSRTVEFTARSMFEIAKSDQNPLKEACYKGHQKGQSLKFHTVTAPAGLVIHAFGPLERRRHDWTLYGLSNINEQLYSVLLVDDVQYCLHGDGRYNRRLFLDFPFSGSFMNAPQRRANISTASARVTAERMYKEVKLYSSSVDFKRKLKVEEVAVGCLHQAAMILTNLCSCLYPIKVSQNFGVPHQTFLRTLCIMHPRYDIVF